MKNLVRNFLGKNSNLKLLSKNLYLYNKSLGIHILIIS